MTKIIQYGNVAGFPYYYAESLRRIGLDSTSVMPDGSDIMQTYQGDVDRQLPTDLVLNRKNDNKLKKLVSRVGFIGSCLTEARLIHYHGMTILPNFLDTKIFRTIHKPTIISWAGGEARIVGMARANNPYFYRQPDEAWDTSVRNRLEAIAKSVRYVATDPEMAPYSQQYFDKVFLLRQPVDLADCPFSPPRQDNQIPALLHIPTHTEAKGTKHIEAAVERLKTEGYVFEFRRLAATLTQKQVKEIIATVDVYVDELRCGSYGATAVESMALGKPTVTYIREDLLEKYPPDMPIVNANPDTIYDRLKELIVDADLRHEIGVKSRAYAEKYHSLEVIGPALLEIYQEIGADVRVHGNPT
jgi:hypothetical protein